MFHSLRPVVCAFFLVSLMTWLTLAGPQAQAGTYSAPVYSTSGQVTVSGATNAVYPYTISPASGSTPGSVSGNGSARATPDIHGNATSLSVVAAGSIIAKFTWQPASPGEHPPATVIIQQTIYMLPTVGASGNGVVTTDTFSDGLGHSGPNTINAILYTEQAPAADGSVSVTFTPSATIMGSSGTGNSSMTGGILITYRVSASPVVVSLSGTVVAGGPPVPVLDGNGSQQILVGQGCTSSLFSSGLPSGTAFSNYNWSVSGTTFQDWQPASPSNSQASFYDPGPGVQTNPTYHWYWNDQTQQAETVTCTATVTPPAGQGAAFQVTATQKVAVYVPTLSMLNNQVGMGYIRNTQQNNVTNSQMIALQPGNPPAGNGSIWTAAVSLPATPSFGTGTWAYLQLIKAGEYIASPSQKATSKDTLEGEGLDTEFPYMGTFFTDGRLDMQGDDPYIGGLNSTIKNVVMTNSFHTYLMFHPPANSTSDVRWVPLAETLWVTNFNASLDPYNNSPYSAWTDYSATQSVGAVSLGYNLVPQNSFPSWTQIINASDDPFIVQ